MKIVATSLHILQQKCTKFDFGWGSSGGAYSAPIPLAGSKGKGLLLRGRREGEGKGSEGRDRRGKGVEEERP